MILILKYPCSVRFVLSAWCYVRAYIIVVIVKEQEY